MLQLKVLVCNDLFLLVDQCMSTGWLQLEVLDCKGGLQSRARFFSSSNSGFLIARLRLGSRAEDCDREFLVRNDFLKHS